MKLKHLILTLSVLICGAAGYAQNSTLLKYLPARCNSVTSFNLLDIVSKIPGETFRQSGLYREMLKKDKGDLQAFFSNPSSTGVDFAAGFIFCMQAVENGSPVPVLFGKLNDEAVFSSTVNKLLKETDTVRTYGTNRILSSKNAGPALAWNEEIFIITGIGGRKDELSKIFTDTTDTRDMNVKLEELNTRINRQLREQCFALLTPKSEDARFNAPAFTNLLNEPGDIKTWNSGTGRTAEVLKKLPPFLTSFLSRIQAAAGMERTSITNFEPGKISASYRSYVSKEIAAIHQQYPDEELPAGLAKRLPEGKILALMMTAINPEKGKAIQQMSGMSELIDTLTRYLKVDLKQLTAAFGSKALLAVMELPAKVQNAEKKKNPFENIGVLFAIPVKDKAALLKLKASAGGLIDSLSKTEKGEKILSKVKPVLRFDDSLCVISLSADMAEAFLNNPGSGPLPSWIPAGVRSPMWMNINFREIINSVFTKSGSTDKPARNKELKIKETFRLFDQLIMTGGGFANGSLNSRMEFRFTDPDKNALLQLFEMINSMVGQQGKMKQTETLKVVPDEGEKMGEVIIEEIPKEIVEPSPPAKKTEKGVKTKG